MIEVYKHTRTVHSPVNGQSPRQCLFLKGTKKGRNTSYDDSV